MRVGIVGAGIAGLSAARCLHQWGHQVVVFEKSKGVGGRVATRRKDGFTWDTGATSFAPRGRAIEKTIIEELDTSELIRLEKAIYVHQNLRVMPGDNRKAATRYVYRKGNTTFPKLLAKDLDVRTETTVTELERIRDQYVIHGEEFDGLILTPPIPQSSLLLWGMRESRPTANARYRSCLSVNLGFLEPLPDLPYHALLDPEQTHPLNWLSLESVKSPDRTPPGGSAFSAQFGPLYSFEHWNESDESLIQTTCAFLKVLFGPKFGNPASSHVMRWKYSQPEGLASFDLVNPVGSSLILASDGLIGGRVEEAFDAGVQAARRLVGTL
jgi:renalase